MLQRWPETLPRPCKTPASCCRWLILLWGEALCSDSPARGTEAVSSLALGLCGRQIVLGASLPSLGAGIVSSPGSGPAETSFFLSARRELHVLR